MDALAWLRERGLDHEYYQPLCLAYDARPRRRQVARAGARTRPGSLEDGSGALLLEDGGRILLEVSAPAGGWLAPRPLTPEEHGIVFLLAQLGAMYASMTGASAELTVEIGLVVFLAAREFTRRVL
jgi:hypothetical protein